MPKTKNSDTEQKHRIVIEEGVKKKSHNRKLPKSDVKGYSKDTSSTDSGAEINRDTKPKILNTLTVKPPIDTINSEIMPCPYVGPYPNNRSSHLSDSEVYEHRPVLGTGSNFAQIPIVFEIAKIINPAAGISSKTEKDPKPIKN